MQALEVTLGQNEELFAEAGAVLYGILGDIISD